MNYIKGLPGLNQVRENIHFISDHLFNDTDVAMERGFPSNYDMIEDYTIKWNRKINPRDIVFYMGNLAKNKDNLKSILDNLHGRINLIVGTEDTHATILNFKNKLASVYYKLDIFINNIPVTMNHHPQRLWNRKEQGAWHLHGAQRYKYFSTPNERIFDVSVDGVFEGEPYDFDDIYDIMGDKDIYNSNLEKLKPIEL